MLYERVWCTTQLCGCTHSWRFSTFIKKWFFLENKLIFSSCVGSFDRTCIMLFTKVIFPRRKNSSSQAACDPSIARAIWRFMRFLSCVIHQVPGITVYQVYLCTRYSSISSSNMVSDVQMNLPYHACFSIRRWRPSASRAPPAPPRHHARATHAHGVIGERTGRISAELGERGFPPNFPGFFFL